MYRTFIPLRNNILQLKTRKNINDMTMLKPWFRPQTTEGPHSVDKYLKLQSDSIQTDMIPFMSEDTLLFMYITSHLNFIHYTLLNASQALWFQEHCSIYRQAYRKQFGVSIKPLVPV
jgi:hypothetical protein